MKIKIYSTSKHPLPKYATAQSAGIDLRANLDCEEVIITPGERRLVPTGLHIELPVGYEAQIRPRSGLALKNGITVLNSPGTIDADYRGEIGVVLINHSLDAFALKDGERIAQMVITQHTQAEWEPVSTLEELTSTERGDGGYGHTGTK